MTNYLLSKGYKYYVRLSGNGQPILGSLVARKVPPRRSNGTWTNITPCLEGCCGVTLTAVDTTVTIDSLTGDLITLAGIVSSNNDTLSFTPVETNSGDVVINADGTWVIVGTVTGTIIVVVTDEHNNSITLTITLNTTA